jgi:uncharacterized membrane protein
MASTTGWTIVLLSGLGCFALKFAGYLLPRRWLGIGWLNKIVSALPIALLSALIAVQSVADGSSYDVDLPRLAGLAVAAVALWRRAPFLVVVIGAALTAALLRLA